MIPITAIIKYAMTNHPNQLGSDPKQRNDTSQKIFIGGL